ncbi:heavy-metal-associated domain-containing protein [Flavobacterium sp. TAB 87]|uniref:heavy-metal-associated domain-containing protein n=1 Tax=Flavobacterium sp. TAB 87 TaxID=1729581 RepID=UPI00076DACA9|nr:heavy-metal-associated domain-containing protein [Flavobacterium sp. TAB 87]KVV14326.1 Copper chaperone CopZ [Flavobacterium sp. TAB 87]
MRNLILLVVFLCISLTAQAQEKKNKNLKYTTEVNGNCDQCKKRIEKAAYTVPGVKSADWNIETHQLYVILNEQKSTSLDLKKAIAKQGHDTDEVKATAQQYDDLHSCCKYERKE